MDGDNYADRSRGLAHDGHHEALKGFPIMTKRAGSQRRGVLLLVVLSMLTLFLMLGAAYLVVSSRSRDTARAFNRLAMQSDMAQIPAEAYLDATFLHVLRGGGAPPRAIRGSGTAPPPTPTFESLLEDKYGRGTTLIGEAQAGPNAPPIRFSGTNPSPVLELPAVMLASPAAATAAPAPTAAELPGRIITLCPDGGEPTSHRILQASGTGNPFRLLIEAASRPEPVQLPTTAFRVVINGREFDRQGATNEAWDAFDSANPFLARVEPDPAIVSTGTVFSMSYLGTSGSATDPQAFDNDNDGRKDSLFLDFGFEGVPTASGTIDLHAAVLVVDLDSRFNVNAHGSLTGSIYPPNHSGWPAGTGTTTIPLGSGYGPAEVNGQWMYRTTGTVAAAGYPPSRIQPGEDPVEACLVGSGTNGLRPTTSRFTSGTTTPVVQSLEGRYGEFPAWTPGGNYRLATAQPSSAADAGDALPGRASEDDAISRVNDQRCIPQPGANRQPWTVTPASPVGIPSLWWTGSSGFDWRTARTSYNAPPDLHGRMKTIMKPPAAGGVVPQVVYAKPEWNDTETQDDPYEILLGAGRPANGWMGDPNTNGFMPVYDNPFSVAELEPVLRPYDIDTFRLPQRLAAVLGSVAEESRLRVTTSSWDTTAITGNAAVHLATWLRSGTGAVSGTSAITGRLGGEVARWERFDLNRPLTNEQPAAYNPSHPYYLQRQAYFKDLYTLLCAILHPNAPPSSGDAKKYAQWAANVVEFRDADSTMTPFEYDTDPAKGWDVDGDVRSTGETRRDVVWGAERPELLIAETSAWENASTGELFVVLHRPWNADAISTTGTTPAEPIDDALATHNAPAPPKNELDLGRKAGNAAATDQNAYPIWRLRVEDDSGGTKIVRLDVTAAGGNDFSSSSITNGTNTPKMPTDSWLCVQGQNTLPVSVATTGTVTIDRGGAFRVPGALPTGPGTRPRYGMVYLERLTAPVAVVSGSLWTAQSGTSVPYQYQVVDQAPIEVVNLTPPNPPTPSKITRDVSAPTSGFWKSLPNGTVGQPLALLGPSSFAGARVKWFPWPNRPFTSAAELFLVPSGSAAEMLKNYESPSDTKNSLLSFHQSASQPLLLLDAVHVPTRFAGIHRTITSDPTDALPAAGIHRETTPVNQLSAYREPGRVNVNTVPADDVWNALVAGPLVATGTVNPPDPDPLRTRIPVSGTTQPPPGGPPANFVGTPATSMADILRLGGPATSPTAAFAADTNSQLVSFGQQNPSHLLFTANRLANTATVRSHVFAVWITLRESIQNDPDSVRYHRAFYLVDRSIPVAHEAGVDNNVWDAVLLRRMIE